MRRRAGMVGGGALRAEREPGWRHERAPGRNWAADARWRDPAAAVDPRDDDGLDSAWSAWTRTVDHWTISACMVLFALGVVLAFATSPALAADNGLDPFHYAWRHMMVGLPAFLALVVCSFLSPKGVRRAGVLMAILGFTALALLPHYGESFGKGAVRWFSFGGVSAQPSEFLKPGLIVICAWMLTALASHERRVAMGGGAAALATLGMAVALLALQPDFGQAALIVAVWATMFFVAGGSAFALFGVSGAAVAIGVGAYATAPYFARRIDAFLDPTQGGGDQVTKAQEAIVSGGWFGRGIGEGEQKDVLPDAHSDFILAVAAEEYGFAMVALILVLIAAILVRALWRLAHMEDAFTRIAGVGLAAVIGLQTLINAAVTAQLAPTTGMTLPFISYGGSSMVATGVAFGLLLALTRRRPRDFSRIFDRDAA